MSRIQFFFSIALLVSAILTFQNCSQFSETYENSSSYLSEETPLANHTEGLKLSLPSQQMRLVNRRYVTELFRDIFTAPNGETALGLENLLFKWSTKRGTQLGGGCDLLGSTTRMDCNGDISNANQPSHVDPNTIRESFKIQLCEELLGQDKGLAIVLSKIGFTSNDSDPFAKEKLQKAYELFYRTDEMPDYYQEAFKGFIFDLKEQKVTDMNIWRGLLILICESPDWQKL